MDIGKNVRIAKTVKLDSSVNPMGIHIGDNTWVFTECDDICLTIIAEALMDVIRLYETYIGSNCVIGVNAIILLGINIGNHCVVAAGTVITKDTTPQLCNCWQSCKGY